MRWTVERGKECSELEIEQDEIDDAISAGMGIVGDFMRQYPDSWIDEVRLVIKCKDDYEAPDDAFEDDSMPCFRCDAFGDDDECYRRRHTFDGCPRIKNLLDDVTINSTKEVNK